MLIKQGNQVLIQSQRGESLKTLPIGNYIVEFNPMMGYYLSKVADFKLPSKLYGDFSIIDRWLRSFEVNTRKNMGILLSGIRGSGKTILAQKLCNEANLPVIMITEAYQGLDFYSFITNPLLGKCIIFIDEFEKIYKDYSEESGGAQESLLQLMDGAFDTRFIFLLTCNEARINENMMNRLSRIKYRRHYKSLGLTEIRLVAEDLLHDKSQVDDLVNCFLDLGTCSYDNLINVIYEVNEFKLSPKESLKELNLEPHAKGFYLKNVETKDPNLAFGSSEYFSRFYIEKNNIAGAYKNPKEKQIKLKLNLSNTIERDFVTLKIKEGDNTYTFETEEKHLFI